MPESLYALALLACPLSMGVMMVVMSRGRGARSGAADARAQRAGLAALQAQVDRLEAERPEPSRDAPVEQVR